MKLEERLAKSFRPMYSKCFQLLKSVVGITGSLKIPAGIGSQISKARTTQRASESHKDISGRSYCGSDVHAFRWICKCFQLHLMSNRHKI